MIDATHFPVLIVSIVETRMNVLHIRGKRSRARYASFCSRLTWFPDVPNSSQIRLAEALRNLTRLNPVRGMLYLVTARCFRVHRIRPKKIKFRVSRTSNTRHLSAAPRNFSFSIIFFLAAFDHSIYIYILSYRFLNACIIKKKNGRRVIQKLWIERIYSFIWKRINFSPGKGLILKRTASVSWFVLSRRMKSDVESIDI